MTELIAASSIGAGLADIKARGIDAHLADLEKESARPRATKRKNKHARRERDPDRMAWTSRQPCCCTEPLPSSFVQSLNLPEDEPEPSLEFGRCRGRIEVHHAGDRFKDGDGTRANDDTVIPACNGHHGAITDHRGPFADWPKWLLRAWHDAMIARYRARYARHIAGGAAAVPW